MQRIRVLIADDHALVREGLRALLAREPTLELVGEAADGEAALRDIERLQPDVALLDITMPGLDGIDVVRRLRERRLRTRVVMLTMHEDRACIEQAMRAGASGYVFKGVSTGEVVKALEAASRGRGYLSARHGSSVTPLPAADLPGEPAALSRREREVLRLVAQGFTNPQVGERLGISARTVEVHRARIAAKLGTRDLPGLVRHAIRSGLVTL
jgi:DNA-binding NarL/FixJ family response regulator